MDNSFPIGRIWPGEPAYFTDTMVQAAHQCARCEMIVVDKTELYATADARTKDAQGRGYDMAMCHHRFCGPCLREIFRRNLDQPGNPPIPGCCGKPMVADEQTPLRDILRPEHYLEPKYMNMFCKRQLQTAPPVSLPHMPPGSWVVGCHCPADSTCPSRRRPGGPEGIPFTRESPAPLGPPTANPFPGTPPPAMPFAGTPPTVMPFVGMPFPDASMPWVGGPMPNAFQPNYILPAPPQAPGFLNAVVPTVPDIMDPAFPDFEASVHGMEDPNMEDWLDNLLFEMNIEQAPGVAG